VKIENEVSIKETGQEEAEEISQEIDSKDTVLH